MRRFLVFSFLMLLAMISLASAQEVEQSFILATNDGTDATGALDAGVRLIVDRTSNLTKVGLRNAARFSEFRIKNESGSILFTSSVRTDSNENVTVGFILQKGTVYRIEVELNTGTQNVKGSYNTLLPDSTIAFTILNLSINGANTTNNNFVAIFFR